MDLNKYFDMQRILDEHILNEHPELKEQDNLPWKLLALQVELGECANEWRGFKKWSNNQEPRTKALKFPAMMEEDKEYYNPLLEEYVDGFHFVLSIGLELKILPPYEITPYISKNTTDHFNNVFEDISNLKKSINEDWEVEEIVELYDELFRGYIGLGDMLGFTWNQIGQAYIAKNEINHERQVNGY